MAQFAANMNSNSNAPVPFDCIGFDLDGTLVDSHQDLGMAINHALGRAGLAAMAMEDMPALIGGGPRRMLRRALDQQGEIDDSAFDSLYEDMLAFYREHLSTYSRPYPGAVAALEELAKRGKQLALITNKREDLARPLLDQLGLTSRFDVILGGDSLGYERAKPAPDLLLEAIRLTGAKRFCYIGDTLTDISAAKAANVPVVAVRFGYGGAADLAKADAVIDDYGALLPALTALT